MTEAVRTEQGKTVARAASMAYDYGWDVGTSHIIDWYMHREVLGITIHFRAQPYASAQRIGRYLDGEEEVEGLYR